MNWVVRPPSSQGVSLRLRQELALLFLRDFRASCFSPCTRGHIHSSGACLSLRNYRHLNYRGFGHPDMKSVLDRRELLRRWCCGWCVAASNLQRPPSITSSNQLDPPCTEIQNGFFHASIYL